MLSIVTSSCFYKWKLKALPNFLNNKKTAIIFTSVLMSLADMFWTLLEVISGFMNLNFPFLSLEISGCFEWIGPCDGKISIEICNRTWSRNRIFLSPYWNNVGSTSFFFYFNPRNSTRIHYRLHLHANNLGIYLPILQ